MTIDGSYQNLRRFIREIETSNQFVVISTIELEPSENKEKKENDQTVPTQATVKNPPQVNNPTGQSPFGNPNAFQQPNLPQQPVTKIDRGKTRGETVTLRLELAAYFRRPNFQPQSVKTSAQ